jgi:hypothetical protein
MKTLQRPMAMAQFLVILLFLLQGRVVAQNSGPQSGIKTTMHAFFQALTTAFPWSLDAQQFQAPEHRQRILEALRRFPADHQGFVHFVVASSLLHRFLDTQPADTSALGEAYYLLGLTETAVSRTTWLSEAPFFLETAIRLDPTSVVAAKAYDVLNTSILTEYTGSLGTRVPPAVQDYLAELRRLRGGS